MCLQKITQPRHCELNHPACQQLAISPWGFYGLLSLLATGLSDSGRRKLTMALGYSPVSVHLDSLLQVPMVTLSSSGFCMTSLVLIDDRLSVNRAFARRAKAISHADIVPFNALTPQESVAALNAKIRNITQGHFEKVMRNTMLTPTTQLIFFNLVHLNASWQQAFPYEATALRPFYSGDPASSGQREVLTMRLMAHFHYTEYADFSVIDLPLRGNGQQASGHNEYLMSILLPRGNMTLARLNNQLDWWSLLWPRLDSAPMHYLDLRLPRFNISSQIALNSPLQHLSFGRVFNRKSASISGMGRVRLASIVQQVRLEVNEGGLIANAPAFHPGERRQSEAKIVDVNRPFMFLVWHSAMQLVLFAGWVQDLN